MARRAVPHIVDPDQELAIRAWCDEHLPGGGVGLTDVREVHRRPWATVHAVSFGTEVLWLKRNAEFSRHEAELLVLLSTVVGRRVPEVVCVDDRTGRFAMRDAGPAVPRHGDPHRDRALWAELLSQYGDTQRRMAAEVGTLVAIGAPDHRPDRLLDVLGAVLSRVDSSRQDLLTAIDGLRADLDRWCTLLAASPVPATIQHDDLHLGNVLGRPGADFAIIDWADAVVAHPFGSLLYPLHASRRRGDTDRQRRTLLAAYLEGWDLGIALADLEPVLDAALRTASIHRSVVWQHIADSAPSALDDYYGTGVPRWLGRMIDGSWTTV